MKITESQLRNVIREELAQVLSEQGYGAGEANIFDQEYDKFYSDRQDTANRQGQSTFDQAMGMQALGYDADVAGASEMRQQFKGSGGYTYMPRDDGGYDYIDKQGKGGTAPAGGAAAASISAELGGGTYDPSAGAFRSRSAPAPAAAATPKTPAAVEPTSLSRGQFRRAARQTRRGIGQKPGLGRAGRAAIRDTYGRPTGGPRKMRDVMPGDILDTATARGIKE
jgi:hypothetical protein